MDRWSLMGEYFALLLLTIIFLRYYGYEWHVAFTAKRKLFLLCLVSAAAFIVLNIVTVSAASKPGCIPL